MAVQVGEKNLGMGVDLTPRMSVVLPAMLGYDSVAAAIQAWEAQSDRDQFELLVCCPSAPAGVLLPAAQRVLETGTLLLHQMRAAAIAEARAEWVLIAEDHCLPDRDFITRILLACDSGQWDALAPALRSGNPVSAWTQGSFLLGYGQWMAPVPRGPMRRLPGHNVVVRRGVLLALGPELEKLMLITSFLMRRLHRAGMRLGLEPSAGMRHFDIDGTRSSLSIFRTVGLGFGAIRTDGLPSAIRAFYWMAVPAVAARHLARAVGQYLRAGTEAGLSPSCLAAAAILACSWALGEGQGAWRGVESVTPELWRSEVKPVQR